MWDFQRYISDRNIARYAEMLLTESDQVRRQTINQLLLDEENRFGATQERLQTIEQHLMDGAARILRQRSLIEKLKDGGHDSSHAERTLQLFEELQKIFVEFRRSFNEAIWRYGP